MLYSKINGREVFNLNSEIEKFLESRNQTNEYYKLATGTKNHRIELPDPIQRLILENIYPTFSEDFNPSKIKTYDFQDSTGKFIELKSGFKNGNVPFKTNQNNCFRIIFCMYDANSIEVHEIEQKDVQVINSMVKNGTVNINLSRYANDDTLKYKQTF